MTKFKVLLQLLRTKLWTMYQLMDTTIIHLDSKNRMVRLGIGKHDGTWFARADLWWFGVRISF